MNVPRRPQELPLFAISLGLEAWERTRGIRSFALRRASEAVELAAATPLGRLLPEQLHPLRGDGADEEAAQIVADAREATAATVAQPPAATVAKPAPVEDHPEPPAAAVEVGAPGAVTEQVEEITEQVHVVAPETRDELPIPDFDNVSVGSLRARLRSLSVEQLVMLREWELAHANRLQVRTMLDNRIAKLGADATYPEESSTAAAAPTQQS